MYIVTPHIYHPNCRPTVATLESRHRNIKNKVAVSGQLLMLWAVDRGGVFWFVFGWGAEDNIQQQEYSIDSLIIPCWCVLMRGVNVSRSLCPTTHHPIHVALCQEAMLVYLATLIQIITRPRSGSTHEWLHFINHLSSAQTAASRTAPTPKPRHIRTTNRHTPTTTQPYFSTLLPRTIYTPSVWIQNSDSYTSWSQWTVEAKSAESLRSPAPSCKLSSWETWTNSAHNWYWYKNFRGESENWYW